MKNTWRKMRKIDKEEPYYKAEDPRTGFKYEVYSVKKDPREPYAAAFCRVISPYTGPMGDLGDTYVTEIPGLVQAWLKAHKED